MQNKDKHLHTFTLKNSIKWNINSNTYKEKLHLDYKYGLGT